jgi:hypothetical protein
LDSLTIFVTYPWLLLVDFQPPHGVNASDVGGVLFRPYG